MLPDWMIITNENFPVGANGLWHGGIHVRPKDAHKWIRPLFSGTVAAGRIQAEEFTEDYGEHTSFSASYLLVEHSMKFVQDSETGSQIPDFNFFSLYMHLQPFGMYNTNEPIRSLDLPFYLRQIITILPTSELSDVRKITVNNISLYNGSTININDPLWFHLWRTDLRIAAKPKIDNEESSEVVIPRRHLKISSLLSRLSIRPRSPEIFPNGVPIFGDRPSDVRFFIGRIPLEGRCFLMSDNTENRFQRIIIDTPPVDVPTGVALKTITSGAVLTEDVSLYEVQQNILGEFALFTPQQYLEQVQSHLEATVQQPSMTFSRSRRDREIRNRYNEESQRVNALRAEGLVDNRYIIVPTAPPRLPDLQNTQTPLQGNTVNQAAAIPAIRAAPGHSNEPNRFTNPNNNPNRSDNVIHVMLRGNDYIEGRAHFSIIAMQINLSGGISLQAYRLRRSVIVKTGLTLEVINQSALPNKNNYRIVFRGENAPVFTDIFSYEAVNPTARGTLTIPDSETSSELVRGFPCIDNDGYIRHLLGHNDSFRHVSGTMTQGQRINITEINGGGSELSRHIIFNNNMRFSRTVEVNTDVAASVDGSTELFSLNKGTNLNRSDIIGLPHLFLSPPYKPFIHLEVFMNDNQLINDLFAGKHVLNVYNIKQDIPLYKKDAPAEEEAEDDEASTENMEVAEGPDNPDEAEALDIAQENSETVEEAEPIPSFTKLNEDERSALGEITVYGYQLRRVSGTEHYGFNHMGREYFIKESDRNRAAENLLAFSDYFTKAEDAVSDEICRDDESIAHYRGMRRDDLRKVVCKFPFDWDALLYARCSEEANCAECVKAFEGKCEHLPQKLIRREHGIDSFPALSRVMQKADVRGDVDFLSSDSNLWHFHPVGFYRHYSRLMPFIGHVEALMNVQDRVINLEAMKPMEGKGMWGNQQGSTFCNHAVFLTIEALDDNFRQFIGNPELYGVVAPPSMLRNLRGTFRNTHGNFGHRGSNLWCVILREQAANSDRTGIHRIGSEEAQEMANRGYVVIGSWMNTRGVNERDNSPHFATVRPNFVAYNPILGPLVANVGASNGIYFTRWTNTERGAFGRNAFDTIEWYYNRNQQFQESDRWISHLESGRFR